LQNGFEALVKAPVVILEREQQHVALLAIDIAERAIAAGDRDSKVERCPTLAGLGLASEDCQSLGDDLRDCPFWLCELPSDKIGR
jgi:hypothetical protein